MDYSTIPAAPPPPGVVPNFENPTTLFPTLVIGLACIQVFTFPFITLRLYINIWMRRCCLEDAFLYVAWCFFVAQTAVTIYAGSTGIASHIWDIDLQTVMIGAWFYNHAAICYAISGGFAKAAIFLQLKKIFTTPLRGTVYWVVIVSLGVNTVAHFVLLFLFIFNCMPPKKMLDPTIPGHCMDWRKGIISMGIINLISDIEALCVPAWAIWKLRLEIKKKLEVFAVFAVGALAVGIACYGLYASVLLVQRSDTTWWMIQSSILDGAELGSIIIVGCCPAIPRLIRQNRGSRYAHRPQNCSNPCCNSGSNSRKSRNGALKNSNTDSSTQESNSVVTLEMYGYAHSMDYRVSEDVSSFDPEDVNVISTPTTTIEMKV